jgi:tetratricopeptide (TPR) repeat protein
VKRGAAIAALLLLTPTFQAAQPPGRVIEVQRGAAAAATFETLWADYSKFDGANDDNAAKVLGEITRLRVERNIGGLESMALALVAKGIEKLRKGELEAAERYFGGALSLDPRLPDAYLGMAQVQARRGPVGMVAAIKHTVSAIMAGLDTTNGHYRLLALVIPSLMLALLAATIAFALALLVRNGSLLLHDLEEELGPTRGTAFARGVFLLLLLLPMALFQGYAWLPLWWLALLFPYLNLPERVVGGVLLLAAVAVGPLTELLDAPARMRQNPLYRASLTAAEGGPDSLAQSQLEYAAQAHPDDRDIKYLLARQYRKTGRDDDAGEIYRGILASDAKDPVALNNLANIEFYRGEFPPAIARYKQGIELGGGARFTATSYYNLAQAHLQKFEFQPATEARAQADRLAADLTRSYESRWRYEKAGAAIAAVVDLAPTPEEVAGKFAGRSEGIAVKNVTGKAIASAAGAKPQDALVNRFLGFAVVFVLTAGAITRWRGNRMITLRCAKCGSPFRRRVTAQDTGELCTQCFHLFVVKDGVSPSAKNKKLMEVQAEDSRRNRTFRILSLLLPGAGQVYGRQPIPGLVLLLLWFGVISLAALAGRPFSLTGASRALLGPWLLAPAGLLLLILYVLANKFRPSFDVEMPVVRRTVRRPAPAVTQ